jgi:chemotaxis protein MotD
MKHFFITGRWPDDCRLDAGYPEIAVPQAASEATTRAYKSAPAHQTRASQSSARASETPFDSLLDDAAQAPASQDPQSPAAPAGKTSAASKPDLAQPPAKSDSIEATQLTRKAEASTVANATGVTDAIDTTNIANAAAADPTATPCKVADDGKAKSDAKLCEQPKAGDDSKSAADAKPADVPTPAALAIDPMTTAVQPLAPGAVITTTPAAPIFAAAAPPAVPPQPAPGGIPQPAVPVSTDAAPATADQAALIAGNAPKFKATNATAPKDDSVRPARVAADRPKAKTIDPAAAQSTSSTTDKPAVQPHEEALPNTRHASPDAALPVKADPQAIAPKTTGDLAQQAQMTALPRDTSPAAAAPAAPPPPTAQAAPIPLAGVAIQIVSMVQAGTNHFEIRLDPPELGRVEVRLAVDRDGHTTTSMIADRSDTLDLLRRDASGLERALQDAGLKTADNSLQFSLRDQSTGQQQSNTPAPRTVQIVMPDSTLPMTDATQSNYSRLAGLRGGIDIRV